MRQRIAMVSALAMGLLFAMSSLALASTTEPAPATPSDNVNAAVSDGAATVKAIITDNIPVILAVVVAFLILKFGKRIVRSIG